MALASIPPGTLAMIIHQSTYENMVVKFEHAKDDVKAKETLEDIDTVLTKTMSVRVEKWKYPTKKYLFQTKGGGVYKLGKMVPERVKGQLLTVDEFINHEDFAPFITGGNISSIDYTDGTGREIEPEQANDNSKNVDVDNRPTVVRPGKRARLSPASSSSRAPA